LNSGSRLFAVALIASLPSPSPAAELPRTLPPLEQCSGDRSFVQFRSRLKQIVAKRDRTAFLELLAPDVLVNFGGASGRKVFEEEWSFDATEYDNLWSQLENMLQMGCARDGGSRIIPSLSMQVEQDFDEEWVVILPGATLYKEAGVPNAKPATVPWSVAVVTSRDSDTMTGVRLADGREGFVSDDRVYEPIGYRMIVEKRGGKWMITAFVAGD